MLLATGMGVDALDLSAELGRATAIGLRVLGVPVPIAATPTGRWLLPVLGGSALHHELGSLRWVFTQAKAGDGRPSTEFRRPRHRSRPG